MSLVRAIDSVPAQVLQAVGRLVLDRRPRRLLGRTGFHAAALDHEPRHDPVEDGAVEELVLDVLEEIRDGSRGFLLEQFYREGAERGFEAEHGGIPGGAVAGHWR
jgi:hypothetical protein